MDQVMQILKAKVETLTSEARATFEAVFSRVGFSSLQQGLAAKWVFRGRVHLLSDVFRQASFCQQATEGSRRQQKASEGNRR